MGRGDDKALRLIAGALIGSDLTERELITLSERLMFDDRWTRKLAMLIKDLSHLPDVDQLDSGMKLGLREVQGSDIELVDELMELFSRKRAPKSHALNILAKANKSKVWEPQPQRSFNENCTNFIKLQPKSEARAVINRVAHLLGYPNDPYLRELAR